MHGWMTSRHEGCVSTMLTESDWSIALPERQFKALRGEMEGEKPKARHCAVFSVLTMRDPLDLAQGRLLGVMSWQTRVRRQEHPCG